MVQIKIKDKRINCRYIGKAGIYDVYSPYYESLGFDSGTLRYFCESGSLNVVFSIEIWATADGSIDGIKIENY